MAITHSLQDLSSLTRDWTLTPAARALSPNHRAAREIPGKKLNMNIKVLSPSLPQGISHQPSFPIGSAGYMFYGFFPLSLETSFSSFLNSGLLNKVKTFYIYIFNRVSDFSCGLHLLLGQPKEPQLPQPKRPIEMFE